MREARCHDCVFGMNIKLGSTIFRMNESAMPWTCINVHVRHNVRYLRRRWHRNPALPMLKCMASWDISLIVNSIAPRINPFALF